MKYKAKALYVHIPFCKNICSYCDFKKVIYNQKIVNKYFESLFFELSFYFKNKYQSIYIGGGTPSCIDEKNLKELLYKLSLMLTSNYKEFCIELNVEDINDNLLKLLKENKVNRLSIGVQTFQNKFIKFCNRKHSSNMAIEKIKLASQYFKNISIDLIYGYPNQRKKELLSDLKIAMRLPITHLSYYSLLIEPNTILANQNIKAIDDDKQAIFYENIVKELKKNHFKRYEISSFAKYKKYQSFHNKIYWTNQHYDAVGLSSSGYKENIRYTNTYNLTHYINKEFTKKEEVILSKEDIMFDEIMLRLRLDEGLNIKKFNHKFHVDFMKIYEQPLKNHLKNHFLLLKNGVLKTTFKGSLVLNSILQDFLF